MRKIVEPAESATPAAEWQDGNQQYLVAAVNDVRAQIERYAGGTASSGAGAAAPATAPVLSDPPALDRLVAAFGLSAFERDVLLMCAGVELDASFASLCRDVQKGAAAPTFSLALAALADPHWSALAPAGPLRYWKMIEIAGPSALTGSALRIDERVLHHLAGVPFLDERLAGMVEPYPTPRDLPETQRLVADRVAAAWRSADRPWTAIQLCGEDEAALCDVGASACAILGFEPYVTRAVAVPAAAAEHELLRRLWTRESILSGAGLLVTLDGNESIEALGTAGWFVDRSSGPTLVCSRQPLRTARRRLLRFDVPKPKVGEQMDLWRDALGSVAARFDGHLLQLVAHFDLGASVIAASAAMVRQDCPPLPTPADPVRLWDTCRVQARARLDDLAQRIETAAAWDDLVLPDLQKQILRDIVTHARHRVRVYEDWGFAATSGRGLGISALFVGASGTGKTLAAEVLGNELRLDVYRIDLSQVVSKYIGETEKNLRRVFDAAEAGGAVLLFDEADALFGKRSEVKDSHDRYANIEVSYLLQRMEQYRGLAILTTNMREALDPAFTRRIRFIVQFPFPDAGQRAEIWRRIFPRTTPTNGLEIARLARLNVAGGNIRNIALGAAFMAAADGQAVRMEHVLKAARAEYAKIERPLTEAEIAGWV